VAQSGARRINVLAHSMGNQALAEALHQIGLTLPSGHAPLLDQVVMAAPDLDVDQLVNMAPEIKRTAQHFTIYSSKNDLPVRFSRWVHGDHCRVGSFAVIDGFDTIDATLLQVEGLLKHSYIGDLPVVLKDVSKLLASGCPVTNRCASCFETRTEANHTYWAFQPTPDTNCTHHLPCP
jgi:esterase/lipase superfamily enzyme